MVKRNFLLTSLFFLLLWAVAGSAASNQDQLRKIDLQIEELEDKKRGYEARALKHDTMAEYLQFDQQAVLETRRHLQLADENRRQAALIQQQIDQLQAKRQKLLQSSHYSHDADRDQINRYDDI